MTFFNFEQIIVLRVPIDLMTLEDLVDVIYRSIVQKNQIIVPNYNLNAIRLIHTDHRMREFYQSASFRHIDGMSIIFIAQMLGEKVNRSHRVTYIDFAPKIFKLASKNEFRVFFVGSTQEVAEKAERILEEKYPDLKLKSQNGYFQTESSHPENIKVIQDINSFKTNILIVGMGMPRQERWILDNLDGIEANVILTGGAIMDYLTNKVSTPPRWLGLMGLEWLYRLINEPVRLWKRYLIEPWYLICILLSDILRKIFGKRQINVLNNRENEEYDS